MNKRKICVVLVDRANYGRMRPVMRAIRRHPDLELQTICTGTMVLERFGSPVKVVERDGFRVDSKIHVELEGSIPTTMAKSVGFAVIEFATELQRLQPDIVLLIGDRYEALAAAVSAAYQNICIAHIQGGEVSGSIDESARHAISKFAQFHFPSTERAAQYLVRLGEDPETVFMVGCPVGDCIRELDTDLPPGMFAKTGLGAPIDHEKPFFLVIFHPVSTEFGLELAQANEVINALHNIHHPTVWLWPNIDAGSDHISKCLRIYRESHPGADWLHLIKNLPPEIFQKTLKKTTCAIGNSSSFVRDTCFMGTPVVLVGDRQEGRERAENVVSVECRESEIREAVLKQCEHGRYEPSTLYGDGNTAARIVEHLVSLTPYVQKRLYYIKDEVKPGRENDDE